MPALNQIAGNFLEIQSSTAWYLADISHSKANRMHRKAMPELCCRFPYSIVEGAHKTQR